MLSFKGKYEIKLINKNSGIVEKEIVQVNAINDVMYDLIGKKRGAFATTAYLKSEILLSSAAIAPGSDLRRPGDSLGLLGYSNILARSPVTTYTCDNLTNSAYISYNFPPPGVQITIASIGISGILYISSNTIKNLQDFISYIGLSVSITQNTNQYLYVKYTLFLDFDVIGSTYYSAHPFVTSEFDKALLYGGMLNLCNEFGDYTGLCVLGALTQFAEPLDVNKLARTPFVPRGLGYYSSGGYYSRYTTSHLGWIDTYSYDMFSRASTKLSKTFGTTDFVGPIGSAPFIHYYHYFDNNDYANPYFVQTVSNNQISWNLNGSILLCGGYSPIPNNSPSISRVFIHPANRINQIFSDPSYPPSSRGSIVLTGTPTIKWPIVGRIKVVSTGQASDIVDAQTATYQLELEPYLASYYSSGQKVLPIHQMCMAYDSKNVKQPAWLWDGKSEGFDASSNYGYYNYYRHNGIHQQIQIGDYIYSIQKTRTGTRHLNLCKWRSNSLETSETLFGIGDANNICPAAVLIGTKIYMALYNDAAANGIWVWDSADPGTAPTKLTITGIINNDVTDLAYDDITGYLWSGHTTGLSKIDLGTLTATQYLNTVGGELDGLTATDVNISPGHLCAHNGFILRGGQTSIRADFASNAVDRSVWLMLDGTGFYKILNRAVGCTISKSDGKIVVNTIREWGVYSVTITGKGTGSATLDASTATGIIIGSSTMRLWSKYQVVELNSNKFMSVTAYNDYDNDCESFMITNYNKTTNTCNYIGYNPVADADAFKIVYPFGGDIENRFGASRNPILVNSYLKLFMADGFLWKGDQSHNIITFGWDGAQWVEGHAGAKAMPATSTDTLLDGVIVQFNNAVGQPWDSQFIATERYTFMYAPCIIKDNLQTFSISAKLYSSKVVRVSNWLSAIPAVPSTPHVVTIPEATTDVNFRDLDSDAITMIVKVGSFIYTKQTNATFQLSNTNSGDDNTIMTVSSGLTCPTGSFVCLTTESRNYMRIIPKFPYYVVRTSSTNIRFKYKTGDANYIPVGPTTTQDVYVRYVSPTQAGYYNARPDGTIEVYVRPEDANQVLDVSYVYTVLN